MSNKNQRDYVYLIFNYFKHLEKCEEIIKYIFNHTELLEKEYMHEYNHEEFRFYSGKIGRYARERNKLLSLLDEKIIKELKLLELIER